MISARSTKKRAARKRGVTIATTKPKPPAKPRALAKKELNSFLALHVGAAIDAYLRGLALKQKK